VEVLQKVEVVMIWCIAWLTGWLGCAHDKAVNAATAGLGRHRDVAHMAGMTREVSMRTLISAAIAVTLLAVPAFAHHGWGSYDAEKPITITAPIEQAELANPHGMMMLSHEGKMWHVTLAPLSRMNARGASADVVVNGKQVTAYGYPKRDGTPEIRAEWIEVDGKRYQLR
jgi:hypothetical protein